MKAVKKENPMKKSLESVLLFRANASSYMASIKKDASYDKFIYALEKMIIRTNDAAKKFEEYMGDRRVERASVDDKGNVIQTDKGQMSYSKEQMKGLNADGKKKMEEMVEVEPYFASYVPDNISLVMKEYFIGFVIKEEDADKS